LHCNWEGNHAAATDRQAGKGAGGQNRSSQAGRTLWQVLAMKVAPTTTSKEERRRKRKMREYSCGKGWKVSGLFVEREWTSI
jgi:hypothetical protein